MELREKIAREIERSIRARLVEIKGNQVAIVDDFNLAADRILAIPEIAEALAIAAWSATQDWIASTKPDDAPNLAHPT